MQPGRAQDGGQSLHHCEDTADGFVFAFSPQSFWFGPVTSLCELSLQIMSALFLLPDVTWDRGRDGRGLP